jgi:gamma-glutamylcyclotransferase (GGCT)/AIG2-like uncharacterized protein YtfP
MVRLFVYGTLKSGQRANHLLAGGVCLGPATLPGGFALYDLGDHPGLIEDPDSKDVIEGELWEVPEQAIPILDEYEGYPSYFGKRIVSLSDGQRVQAYLYNGQPTTHRILRWPASLQT